MATKKALNINKRPKDDVSDNEQEPDLKLLHGNGTTCTSQQAATNIIARCDALKRLTLALKGYESGQDDCAWDSMLAVYGRRMLSDFAHLMSDHGDADSIAGIMQELGPSLCSKRHACAFGSRHFQREQ